MAPEQIIIVNGQSYHRLQVTKYQHVSALCLPLWRASLLALGCRWLDVVTGVIEAVLTVEWKPSNAQIWIDTGFGRSKWKEGAFGFANSKIAGYGLHER